MKEKMWFTMGIIFAVGAVLGMLLKILPVGDFKDLALIAVMAIFNEARISSNNKSWDEWTEDAAKQAEARYQALVALFKEKTPE